MKSWFSPFMKRTSRKGQAILKSRAADITAPRYSPKSSLRMTPVSVATTQVKSKTFRYSSK